MANDDQPNFERFVSEIDRASPKIIKDLVQSFAKDCTSADAGKIVDFRKFLDNGRLPIDSTAAEQEFYKRTVTRMVDAGVLNAGYLDLINEWRFVRGKDGAKKA